MTINPVDQVLQEIVPNIQLMNFDLNKHLQNSIGNKAYKGEDLIDTPINKPRNGELRIEHKNENKKFSATRIFVEH